MQGGALRNQMEFGRSVIYYAVPIRVGHRRARAPSLSAREGVRITPLGHLGERVLVATTAIPTDGLPRTVTVLWRDFSINEHR